MVGSYRALQHRLCYSLLVSPLRTSNFTQSPCTIKPRNGAISHVARPRAKPQAKLQVEVVTLCKRSGKDAVFDETIDDLTLRMSSVLTVTSRWVRPERASTTVADLSNRAPVMLLDAKGRMPRDSEHFAELLFTTLEQSLTNRMSFVIGGPEGLPADVRSMVKKGNKVSLLSLGPMTFTHKMVSLVTTATETFALQGFINTDVMPKTSFCIIVQPNDQVRLFLYEQIYRATEIRANSKYHK